MVHPVQGATFNINLYLNAPNVFGLIQTNK
jgi:hypothetical protein